MKETTTKFDSTSLIQHQLSNIFFKLINLVKKNAVTMSCLDTSYDSNEDIETDERKQIALVLYPKVAFLNHSCRPNAFLAFGEQGQVQVKITQIIEKNEEINITYGPMATKTKHRERQTFLTTNYNFKCRCQICHDVKTSNDMDLALELASKLACPACRGPIQRHETACNACEVSLDGSDSNKKYSMERLLKTAELARINLNTSIQKPSKAYELLTTAYRFATEAFFEMNDDLKIIRDNLALQHCRKNEYNQAAELVFANYKLICMRHGTDSVEAAHELLKLGGLWSRDKEKEKRGMIAYRHASNLLRIFHFDYEKDRIRKKKLVERSKNCSKNIDELMKLEFLVYRIPDLKMRSKSKEILKIEKWREGRKK